MNSAVGILIILVVYLFVAGLCFFAASHVPEFAAPGGVVLVVFSVICFFGILSIKSFED